MPPFLQSFNLLPFLFFFFSFNFSFLFLPLSSSIAKKRLERISSSNFLFAIPVDSKTETNIPALIKYLILAGRNKVKNKIKN